VDEEALRPSHVFTRSRQAPSVETPRHAGLSEHILPDSNVGEGQRSVPCIRLVLESG
jgi:hypothetical protein